VSDAGWGNEEALVICKQLGYLNLDVIGVMNSYYGKPNLPFFLSDVVCTGRETNLELCQSTLLSPDEISTSDVGDGGSINAAGVTCGTGTVNIGSVVASNPVTIVMILLIIVLIAAVIGSIGMFAFVIYKRKKGDLSVRAFTNTEDFTIGHHHDEKRGVENPTYSDHELYGDDKTGLDY
jgi:hypothetical protein